LKGWVGEVRVEVDRCLQVSWKAEWISGADIRRGLVLFAVQMVLQSQCAQERGGLRRDGRLTME
jgi:hypothetical protein